jgi:putative FmdB family regulatory protein
LPMYEYKCNDCGKTATKLRKMDDRDQPIECGDCGGKSIRVASTTGRPNIKGGTPRFHP